MNGISASLKKWFSERPQWLQIAATRLLQQSELTDKDISELTTLCQQEAEGKLPKTISSFPATTFSQGAAGSLRLCSISDVEGVNALAPKKPLEFGKGNITIVYGNNGSGKSGSYIRLAHRTHLKAVTFHLDEALLDRLFETIPQDENTVPLMLGAVFSMSTASNGAWEFYVGLLIRYAPI